MIVRPYGIWLGESLELGAELVLEDGVVREIRPHTGIPEAFVLSPAFVNAHSHFEYLGLEGQVEGATYGEWIANLTRMKAAQSTPQVSADAVRAGALNRATGVAFVAEHSDRLGSGWAMLEAGLQGVIFQEVITFREREQPKSKLELVGQKAHEAGFQFGGPVYLSPHAYHTVDPATLYGLASRLGPLSIHVAETGAESEFTRTGGGPIGEFYRASGAVPVPTGQGVVETLGELGYLRRGVQFVHCCALEEGDIERLRDGGVTVAHCPRSNERLQCPRAPVREMLDAGVVVGLGLDSAASSGPIDYFAEMRSALAVSRRRGRPITADEVWSMGTESGRLSVPIPGDPWRIEVGSRVPMIAIEVAGAVCIEDVIEGGSPERVRWL